MRSRSFAFLLCLSVFLFATDVFAQTFRGSIQGTITDSSGAAVSEPPARLAGDGRRARPPARRRHGQRRSESSRETGHLRMLSRPPDSPSGATRLRD